MIELLCFDPADRVTHESVRHKLSSRQRGHAEFEDMLRARQETSGSAVYAYPRTVFRLVLQMPRRKTFERLQNGDRIGRGPSHYRASRKDWTVERPGRERPLWYIGPRVSRAVGIVL